MGVKWYVTTKIESRSIEPKYAFEEHDNAGLLSVVGVMDDVTDEILDTTDLLLAHYGYHFMGLGDVTMVVLPGQITFQTRHYSLSSVTEMGGFEITVYADGSIFCHVVDMYQTKIPDMYDASDGYWDFRWKYWKERLDNVVINRTRKIRD